MNSTEAATQIIEKMDKVIGTGEWIKIQDLGMTKEELAAGILELLESADGFRISTEPIRNRITPELDALAPKIGGEKIHHLSWV